MKLLSRATLASLLASGSLALASCNGGGSGFSGPPTVLNPGATASPTAVATVTASSSPTAASTTAATPTAVATMAATPTASATASATPTATATGTTAATPTASATATATTAATMSPTPVATPTAVAATPSPTPAATSTPVMTAAVCPPNPVPSPLTSTYPFPNGNGGSINNPAYYDSTGTTTFPANNAPSGLTLTVEEGGNNFDSFTTSGSNGGTPLVYIDSSTNASSAITFSGTAPAVVIAATSPSCFTSAHSYYMDVTVSGVTLASPTGVASNNGNTQTFSITTPTKQFPTGKVQLVIFQM